MSAKNTLQYGSRVWVRWFQSGAVAQPRFPTGSLQIEGIGTSLQGRAKGYSTLSLGSQVVGFGPDWSVCEPRCAVVVPTRKKHRPGLILERIPGNAVPVRVFFPD